MATQVQTRRGNFDDVKNFTGAVGEVISTIDTGDLTIHDGVNPGGNLVALAELRGSGIGRAGFDNNSKAALQSIVKSGGFVSATGHTISSDFSVDTSIMLLSVGIQISQPLVGAASLQFGLTDGTSIGPIYSVSSVNSSGFIKVPLHNSAAVYDPNISITLTGDVSFNGGMVRFVYWGMGFYLPVI